MKKIEDKITQISAQKSEAEAQIELLTAEIETLAKADEALAVEDLIAAREHTPCLDLKAARLQFAADAKRLKITDQALKKLEHDRQAAQDKIHLKAVSVIAKRADKMLDDYQSAVDSMAQVIRSLKMIQDEQRALDREMSLNRGRKSYENNDDCAVPSLNLLTSLTNEISLLHANRQHAVMDGCLVVGGKIDR